MYYLYILLSERTSNYYIGSTGNIEDRITRHNSGRSKSTSSGMPWLLVYSEEFDTRSEAIHRELEIKGWKSHQRISNLIQSQL